MIFLIYKTEVKQCISWLNQCHPVTILENTGHAVQFKCSLHEPFNVTIFFYSITYFNHEANYFINLHVCALNSLFN
jgi:hypothetical protein